VFGLVFAVRNSAKLFICFGMLKLGCLGCKSGFKAIGLYAEEVLSAGKKKIYTGMVDGRASDRDT
jgi:hypothetical protein